MMQIIFGVLYHVSNGDAKPPSAEPFADLVEHATSQSSSRMPPHYAILGK
ncbi:hypothetical protein N9I61_01505 [Flavobacteriales bacterium]|jgi:hypothetical protein|nr:hypothetical protein [Flavobacteriales bacterium]